MLRGEDPTAFYLTWLRSPDTTMTVCWITPNDGKPFSSDDTLYFSPDGGSTWHEAAATHFQLPNKTPYLLHSVELTNLTPDTKYIVQIGKDHNSRPYRFKTLPSSLQSADGTVRTITFVAGGDMYHDTLEALSKTNRQASRTSPDFALVGGDIAYAASAKGKLLPSWTKSLFDMESPQKFDRWLTWIVAWSTEMVRTDGCSIPMLPVLGNHDCEKRFGGTPADAPFFYALFPMPGIQGYNVLDFGNYLTLILLDTGHTHPIEGAQTQWLEKTLQDRVDVPNKFALYHVPAYPSARAFTYKHSVTVRNAWTPLFDKYHLTAAIENHDHDYKRTFPLTAGKTATGGVLYFGDGAWGVSDPRKPLDIKAKGYIAEAKQTANFLYFKISPKGRTMVAYTPNGDQFDSYSW